ncbi:MAG: DedA family protein [Archangiaceae bacterium]|nr:DedA family protein [Archangiaceae bacterium]
MQTLLSFVDIFLHVDKHLQALVAGYGLWVYAILFVIIFCETGLVVTAILPGDSLLFAAGSLCALGASEESRLSLAIVIPLLIVAAILGDAVNYSIGKALGPGYLEKKNFRFIKKEHLDRTQKFYEKYGGKTIVLARFVPIVRTFAPFVAGIGKMPYSRFLTFNVVGALAWVIICTVAGFVFGQMEVVKKNFELVILAIIFISVLPIAIEALRSRKAQDPKVPAAG